jgi:hypothetical protein
MTNIRLMTTQFISSDDIKELIGVDWEFCKGWYHYYPEGNSYIELRLDDDFEEELIELIKYEREIEKDHGVEPGTYSQEYINTLELVYIIREEFGLTDSILVYFNY